MKAVDFKESNHKFAEDQDQYHTLPGHFNKKIPSIGEFIFCMKLGFWERVRILFTGKMWCALLTHNKPLQPSRFSVKKSDFFLKRRFIDLVVGKKYKINVDFGVRNENIKSVDVKKIQ